MIISQALILAGRHGMNIKFAGIGGIRLAFENEGCECVFSSEWSKFSRKTYYANFHDMPAGDITKINAGDIPDHDILTAGFPCQPSSIAGVSKRHPTGFSDLTQGTLFLMYAGYLTQRSLAHSLLRTSEISYPMTEAKRFMSLNHLWKL